MVSATSFATPILSSDARLLMEPIQCIAPDSLLLFVVETLRLILKSCCPVPHKLRHDRAMFTAPADHTVPIQRFFRAQLTDDDQEWQREPDYLSPHLTQRRLLSTPVRVISRPRVRRDL
jgi:hypothetical protein